VSPQILPMPRQGGYWLFCAGEQRFVTRAEIIPFPRRERAIARAVGAELERAIDGEEGQ